MKKNDSDFHINPSTDADWLQASGKFPEKITINGLEYNSSNLSEKTKKLALIYMNDRSILNQFKELLALAELGLNTISKEVQESIDESASP
jgi:hypothetical protein